MNHLALGDYVYQGPFLKALAEQYPNMQLDIWLDDCRKRTKSWHAGRSKVLTEWLKAEGSFGRVYPIAGSKQQRQEMLRECQQQGYDLVFFMASLRSASFATYANKIAANSYRVGISVGDDSCLLYTSPSPRDA